MTKRFLTLLIAVVFCNSLVSWVHAVTFRFEEFPDSRADGPHDVGAEFKCLLIIDAADAANINLLSIIFEFDPTKIQPKTPNTPFEAEDEVGEPLNGWTPFANQIIDNKYCKFQIANLTATPLPAENGQHVATVVFKQTAAGASTVAYRDLGGDNRTVYQVQGSTNQIVPTFIDGEHSLPVELVSFTGTLTGNGVRIQWRTMSETNNLGFNVYRSETPNGPFEKINPLLIKGAGTDATPHDYQFVDEKIEPWKVYYYYLEDVDFKGITKKSDLLQVDLVTNQSRLQARPLMPVATKLLQNFPNPFNPETWIPYRLAKDASVTLTICDTTGAVVRTIQVGHKPASAYESKDKAIYWDGRNDFGERVASGVYFYTLTAKDFTATRKMLILK